MADTVQAITVRRSIVVEAPQGLAFDAFTSGFDSWWPRGHHIGKAEMLVAVMEPRQGGRWYEKGVDGSECDWGTVLVWDPPKRVVLSWHLNGRWEREPDRFSEVNVRFHVEGPSRTRVELEHRGLERHAFADDLRAGVDGKEGWPGLLERYAAEVKGRLTSE
jgi:uncharacterized protein YndB with AHSA1/START domain